jgi:hypothetical protein
MSHRDIFARTDELEFKRNFVTTALASKAAIDHDQNERVGFQKDHVIAPVPIDMVFAMAEDAWDNIMRFIER